MFSGVCGELGAENSDLFFLFSGVICLMLMGLWVVFAARKRAQKCGPARGAFSRLPRTTDAAARRSRAIGSDRVVAERIAGLD